MKQYLFLIIFSSIFLMNFTAFSQTKKELETQRLKYQSDIKKVIQWYNLLLEKGILELKEEKPKKVAKPKKESEAKKESKPKAKAKKAEPKETKTKKSPKTKK